MKWINELSKAGRTAAVALLMAASSLPALAQSERAVYEQLKMVGLGNTAAAKKELPALVAKYPNDPGVTYLQATLTEDGNKALALYKKIVTTWQNSEWADDAQWRIVQIYASQQRKKEAHASLLTFRSKYPESPYLVHAVEVVRTSVGLPTNYDGNSSRAEAVPSAATPQMNVASAGSLLGTPSASAVPAPSAAIKAAERERFGLQVGTYATEQSAQQELDKFLKARLRAEVVAKTVNNTRTFAVVIGEYSTREAADKAKVTVQKFCGCQPFVVAK
jgi:septal ring-binding cell division protein DamX